MSRSRNKRRKSSAQSSSAGSPVAELKKEDGVTKIDYSQGKVFIPDTNVILDNPKCIFEFGEDPDDIVLINDSVLGELDNFKSKPGILGRYARQFSTMLERRTRNSDISSLYEKGITIWAEEDGKKVKHGRILFYSKPEPVDYDVGKLKFRPDLGKEDLDLILTALKYEGMHPNKDTKIVTNDINVVITSRTNGVKAEHRVDEQFDLNNIYQGYRFITDNPNLEAKVIETFGSSHKSDPDAHLPVSEIDEPWVKSLIGNEYVIFPGPDKMDQIMLERKKGGKGIRLDKRCIYRFDIMKQALMPMQYDGKPILGFTPANFEQQLLFDLGVNDDVLNIAAVGPAGTGKTFIALLMSLYKTVQKRAEGSPDASIAVSKRFVKVAGEEAGYLPGDKNDKHIHNYAGIADNFYTIVKKSKELQNANVPFTLRQAIQSPEESLIELNPIGDMRGRSLGEYLSLIVDEGQNVESKVMETVLTRSGDGRIWVVGDAYQPDNPFTREDHNGLLSMVDMITRIDNPEYSNIYGVVRLHHPRRGKTTRSVVKYWRKGGMRKKG